MHSSCIFLWRKLHRTYTYSVHRPRFLAKHNKVGVCVCLSKMFTGGLEPPTFRVSQYPREYTRTCEAGALPTAPGEQCTHTGRVRKRKVQDTQTPRAATLNFTSAESTHINQVTSWLAPYACGHLIVFPTSARVTCRISRWLLKPSAWRGECGDGCDTLCNSPFVISYPVNVAGYSRLSPPLIFELSRLTYPRLWTSVKCPCPSRYSFISV